MPLKTKNEVENKFYRLSSRASNELLASNVAKELGMTLSLEALMAAPTLLAGKGILAAIGVGTGPIGLAVGAVLLVGGVSYAIYEATSKTNDNIPELIEAFEALDSEGTEVDGIVRGWISTLKELT